MVIDHTHRRIKIRLAIQLSHPDKLNFLKHIDSFSPYSPVRSTGHTLAIKNNPSNTSGHTPLTGTKSPSVPSCALCNAPDAL